MRIEEPIVVITGSASGIGRAVAVSSIIEEEATIAPIYDGPSRKVPAETVIVVTANRPNRDLYNDLMDDSSETYIVGDANSPRFVEAAIREGHVAAKGI